jgi:hypothetical protein
MEFAYDAIRISQPHGHKLRMFEAANLRKLSQPGVETAAAEQPESAIRQSDADNVLRRRGFATPDAGLIGHQRSFGEAQNGKGIVASLLA